MTEYTRAQVAQHNTKEDCWIIIGKDVLSIPPNFAELHPGKAAYMHAAGKDATETMGKIHQGQGHAASAYEWAQQFKIGQLSD